MKRATHYITSLPFYINTQTSLSQSFITFSFFSSTPPPPHPTKLTERGELKNGSPQNGVLGRCYLLLSKQQHSRLQPRNVCLRYKGRSNNDAEILSAVSSNTGESKGFNRTADVGRESRLVRKHCGGDTTSRNQRVRVVVGGFTRRFKCGSRY